MQINKKTNDDYNEYKDRASDDYNEYKDKASDDYKDRASDDYNEYKNELILVVYIGVILTHIVLV